MMMQPFTFITIRCFNVYIYYFNFYWMVIFLLGIKVRRFVTSRHHSVVRRSGEMPRPSRKHVEELPLTSTMSVQYNSAIELSIASTRPFPFDEDIGEEKFYTVSDKKFVKTYYTNGNFQCQLTTKTSDFLEVGTTLNLHQFKMLLDSYSKIVSTLHAAFTRAKSLTRFTI